MRIGEALEPSVRRLRLLRQREHAFRRRVVDDVELVVHLRDHALVGRARIHVGDVFRPRLAVAAERRALPVVAHLPDEPFAVRVVAVQHVGAERDRLVEVEFQRIGDLLEDVLGHHPDRVPAHREERMEARIRLLQLEHDGVAVGRRHRGDVDLERRAPAHAVGLHVQLGGEDDVGRRELDAVAPEDAGAQLDRHLGEVGVVDRLVGRERIHPDAVEAALRIDVPEGVHRKLVQPGGLAARIHGPDVEPARILDRPFGVLDDQRLVAWQIRNRLLRQRRKAEACKNQGEREGLQRAHRFLSLTVFLGVSVFVAASKRVRGFSVNRN